MAREHRDARRARAGAEEGRQRDPRAARRARDPPDQRPRRRLLPRADDAPSCARSSSRSSAPARRRSRRCAGRPASTSRSARSSASSSRSPQATSTRSRTAAIVSDRGLDIAPAAYDENFVEEHVERSNALHSRRTDGSHVPVRAARALLAPLRRLSPLAREAAREAGLGRECRDAFRSIVVRSVELRVRVRRGAPPHRRYEPPDAPAVDGRAARRHRLRRQRGAARPALPPLHARRRRDDPRREDRAADVAEPAGDRGRPARRRRDATPRSHDDELRHLCEQAIRNYDPCISCATHFLDLEVERRMSVVVIGVGNAYRGDDGAGLAVADARARPSCAGASRPGLRAGADAAARRLGGRRRAFVVDAVASGAARRARCTASTRANAAPAARSSARRRRTRSASPRRSSSRAYSDGCRSARSSTASKATTFDGRRRACHPAVAQAVDDVADRILEEVAACMSRQ